MTIFSALRRFMDQINGKTFVKDWQARIDAAQKITTYLINGQTFQRIRYGDEKEHDWNAERLDCHDCGVSKGQYHVPPACDVEECPRCGGQMISCDCEYEGDKKNA